jgi:hypothetical protein
VGEVEVVTVQNAIYRAAGSPMMEGTMQGQCRTCGTQGDGILFSSWVRDTFTDHDKLKSGEIVCAACQFCFTDRNKELARALGLDGVQRMRNYSHFVVNGVWTPLSKGAKPRMRELFAASPEVAVIATSGQKHIIFRCAPGRWQVEEATHRPFPDALNWAISPVDALLAHEFSKAEIRTGQYIQRRVLAVFALWREMEAIIKPLRGSPAFDLALFLAQSPKKEEEEADGTDNSGISGQANLPLLAGR